MDDLIRGKQLELIQCIVNLCNLIDINILVELINIKQNFEYKPTNDINKNILIKNLLQKDIELLDYLHKIKLSLEEINKLKNGLTN